MDTSSFKVVHDKDCFFDGLPEGLCECMRRKLLDLFTIIDRLTEENAELMQKIVVKKSL